MWTLKRYTNACAKRRKNCSVLSQEVIAAWTLILMSHSSRFISCHFGQIYGLHQSVHSSDTDVYAIITTEYVSDFISTKTFIIVRINLKNDTFDVQIFLYSRSWNLNKMLIICATIYMKCPTKRFNVMLESQFVNDV